MVDAGGTLWFIIAVVGAVILALGLFFSAQKAKDAPQDPETLRAKREATEENFSDAAVEERPIFGDAEPDSASTLRRKQRPRVTRNNRSRRNEPQPRDHLSP